MDSSDQFASTSEGELFVEINKLENELEKTVKELEDTKKKLQQTEKYNGELRLEIEKLNCLLRLCKTTNTSYEEQIDAETQVNEQIIADDLSYDYYAHGSYTSKHEVSDSPIAPWSIDEQTKSLPQEDGEIKEEAQSLAENLKEAAESAMQQSGYVYDEKTGLYYDHKSGYYYDSERQLYYEPNSGTYYYFEPETGTYKFHSQVDLSQYNYTNQNETTETAEIGDVITAMSDLRIDKTRQYANTLGKKKKRRRSSHERKKKRKHEKYDSSENELGGHSERKKHKRKRRSKHSISDKEDLLPVSFNEDNTDEKKKHHKHRHKHRRRKKQEKNETVITTYSAKPTNYSLDINSRRVKLPLANTDIHETNKNNLMSSSDMINDGNCESEYDKQCVMSSQSLQENVNDNEAADVEMNTGFNNTETVESADGPVQPVIGPRLEDYAQHLKQQVQVVHNYDQTYIEKDNKVTETTTDTAIDEIESESDNSNCLNSIVYSQSDNLSVIKDKLIFEDSHNIADNLSIENSPVKVYEENDDTFNHENNSENHGFNRDTFDGHVFSEVKTLNEEQRHMKSDTCVVVNSGNFKLTEDILHIKGADAHEENLINDLKENEGNKSLVENSDSDNNEMKEHEESDNMTQDDPVKSKYLDKKELEQGDNCDDVKHDCKDVEEGEITDESVEALQNKASENDGESHSEEDLYSSISSSESYSDDQEEEIQASAVHWPPCIRAMVKQSDTLDVGTLYIITCTGATVGRDITLNHSIVIPDTQVSKMHSSIEYNEEMKTYLMKDHASQNGTFLNSQRLSKPKKLSDAFALQHGDTVQIGGTEFHLHIHQGTETCDGCEPGQVQASLTSAKPEPLVISKAEKERLRKKELKLIKKKFGLENAAYEGKGAKISSTYVDKAAERRTNVGSDNPYRKDDLPASVHVAISSENKGHRLLSKMGWKEGHSLGKTIEGIKEPIQVEMRANQSAGIGSLSGRGHSIDFVNTAKNTQRWLKTQQRYEDIDKAKETLPVKSFESKQGIVPVRPVDPKQQWVQGKTYQHGEDTND